MDALDVFEEYYEKQGEEELIENFNREEIWTCQDGTKIKIKDMKTSHIKNALAMLKRKGYVGLKELNQGLSTTPPNGEMALLAYEQGIDELIESPTTFFIDWFEEELERRANE